MSFAGDGKVSLWKENLKGKFEEVSVSAFSVNWISRMLTPLLRAQELTS